MKVFMDKMDISIDRFWVQQVALHHVSGHHPISWRPEQNKRMSLLEQEGLLQQMAFGLEL